VGLIAGRRSLLVGMAGAGGLRAGLIAVGAVLATRLLDPHERGLMVIGSATAGVAALVAGLGTGSALRASLPGVGEVARRELIAAFSWWTVVSSGVAGLLSVLVSMLTGALINPTLAAPAFLLAAFVNAAGTMVLTHLPDAWYAGGRFAAAGGWAVGVAAAGTAGVLVGVVLGGTAWATLLAQGAAMVVAGMVQSVWLRASGFGTLCRVSRGQVAALARKGAPGLGLTLGMVLALRVDRYVVAALIDPATVAVYALAVTMAGLPGLVPIAVGQVTLREIAAGAGMPHLRQAARRAVLWSAASALPVAAAGWLLVVPVFGPAFAGARPLLLALLLAGVAFAPFEVASRALLGRGRLGTAGALGLGGCAAAVVLYPLLVALFGVPGAVLAGLAVATGLSTAAWRLACRHLAIPPRAVDSANNNDKRDARV
jgi:O-antigen/teichoic acid export membrane protein